ncbi:TPA: hypothetical protein ACXJVP_005490 [Pseudomonas aeruginosa]
MLGQVTEVSAYLQADYLFFVVRGWNIEGEKKLVNGGAVEWVHVVFRVAEGGH